MLSTVSRLWIAAALSAGLSICGGAAFAQAKKSAQKPAPAEQPAQAAQPAQNNKVELKPSQPTWTKVCGKDEAAKKEICYTTRDFGADGSQQPVLALAVYDIKGDDTRVVRLLMPVGLMLEPGFRFSIDKGATLDGRFQICFPNGCFAESKVKTASINQLKKGSLLNVYVKNQVNNEVHFVLPLDGFGKSFDGPPVDPKVLEAQQKALAEQQQKQQQAQQQELQKQQELQRQLEERARREREKLEGKK